MSFLRSLISKIYFRMLVTQKQFYDISILSYYQIQVCQKVKFKIAKSCSSKEVLLDVLFITESLISYD